MLYLCRMEKLVNKVAESGLLTLNLEELMAPQMVLGFDIAPFLFKGLILREKEFRAALPEHDWSQYQNKKVAVFCSADAIIPMWAFMLIAVYLKTVQADIYYGTPTEIESQLLLQRIEALDSAAYVDQRVVVKGCGERPISPSAYLAIAGKLSPVVKSLMFGEPCSTVPIYKKK